MQPDKALPHSLGIIGMHPMSGIRYLNKFSSRKDPQYPVEIGGRQIVGI
jgi:hypothetical protein